MQRTAPRSWRSLGFIFGIALVIVAGLALAYEIRNAFETGAYRVIPAGELWFKAHVGSLNLAQAITQRYVHPALWDPVIVSVLRWPLWSSAGALGAFLLLVMPPAASRREGEAP
ncbi:MAG: hypothetical protein ACR2PO_18545 [Methyloligellaceae bacterium]